MKRIVSLSLVLASAVVLLSGCNCYNKMAKNVKGIDAKCTPSVLTLKGNTVAADVTVTFPPKYFSEMAILRVTPVLVFEGGEIAGTPKFVQGEGVKDNFTVIPWKQGGSYTQNVSFPYDKRAAVSKLVLRFDAKCSESCSEKYNDYLALGGNAVGANGLRSSDIVVAEGISNLQDNIRATDYLTSLADNYKKTRTISPDDVSIMYTIGKSDVRPAQLTSEQVKLLEAFVKDNSNKEGVSMGSVYVSGYASPDGPVTLNDKLSQARGNTAKTAVEKQLTAQKQTAKYDVAAYGEDWDGFKNLVASSNMKDKDLVMQVLNMYDNPVKREDEIRNMSVVFDVLAKDILPQLRRAKVSTSAEVQGLNDSELLAAAKTNLASLDVEQLLYTASLTKDNAEKVRILTYAAEKYNDYRAYNNLGIAQMNAGQLDAAKKAFTKAASLKSDPAISNNLGALAVAQGNIAEAKKYLSSLNTADAKANQGLVALAEGDYAAAQKNLKGYDLAVAEVLNNNLDKASAALKGETSADADYLRAVIAARKGEASNAISNLKSAIAKKPALAEAAKKDVEFSKLFALPEFKAL